jgi:ssDNA-binding Zn-finger/Zn-ribbon topoisomerase 1
MEILRIKCPSCGVVLEVKNSKNEAVKKIKCPNCQTQLAVTFADLPTSMPPVSRKPIDKIYQGETALQLKEGINTILDVPSHEALINVLALANGDWKYVLQALSSEVEIKLNCLPLQKGY